MSNNNKEHLVGVNYFAGWWRELPNKWHTDGVDWRLANPGRVPLLGEYNEQETMDKEIVAASDYGVDYFQILWYPLDILASNDLHKYLNVAVDQFMESPNSSRMSFNIEYCNHPPFYIDTDEKWDAACRVWCKAMTHPSYLRIDDKPVFKIHSTLHFLEQCGNEQDLVDARLAAFRSIAQEFGIKDIIIGGGIFSEWELPASMLAPYDFLGVYMDLPNIPALEEPYPFKVMTDFVESDWFAYLDKMDKPFVPFLPAGWDPRPWKDKRAPFVFPDRENWKDILTRVKKALDNEPRFGIPCSGGRAKTMSIYAWNEFGEGGILAPTKGDGYMKLEVVKEVFER